jgi:hypothetical protein
MIPLAAVIVFGLVTGYGDLEAGRLLAYAFAFGPFLAGLGLYATGSFLYGRFRRPKMTRLLMGALVFVIISLCIVQFYHYQPLVPTGEALGLSSQDYVIYVHQVNTSHQVLMIYFVLTHCSRNSRVASDILTRDQTLGLFYGSLESVGCVLIYQSQLSGFCETGVCAPLADPKWNLFLLHDKRAGPLMEPMEFGTTGRLESFKNHAGWNIVYDDGSSFVIERP